MAIRQVVMSDISGAELSDDTHATIIIEHPDFRGALAIDASVEEGAKFQNTALRLVTVTVMEPNKPARRAVVETKVLDKLFNGLDFNKVLEGARRADAPTAKRNGRTPKAPTAEKRDYSSPEFAGVEHRGRVTEAEAQWVRKNLKAANANRAREGQAAIDPADEKMKKRYSF